MRKPNACTPLLEQIQYFQGKPQTIFGQRFKMAKKAVKQGTGKAATQYGPPLGEWFTPLQKDQGFISVWNRITREEFDIEEILRKPSMTYFNRPFAVPEVGCEYDQRYHFPIKMNVKSKRDDGRNIDDVRANIHREELERVVPLCTSQNFGHRKTDLEGASLCIHKRRAEVKELLRRNYLNLKPVKKQPPNQRDFEL